MGKSVLAGPSTSTEPSTPTRKPVRLTRSEFTRRLFDRARTRYGLELDEGWLQDLIKDGLVPGGAHEGNSGLRPIYTQGYRSYRRALQIARFRPDGIVDRDAIRIFLFIKKYGQSDIREALWKQYSKYGRGVVASTRSGYADNSKPIPAGHKSSLMKSVGPLDARFDKAGLRLPDDYCINGVRLTKNAAEQPRQLKIDQVLKQLATEPMTFERLADLFIDLFKGLLLFSTKEGRQAAGPDYIERLILDAEDWRYVQARAFCGLLRHVNVTTQFFRSFDIGADAPTTREALAATDRAILCHPWWAALILVIGLLFTHSIGARFSEDMALVAMHRIKKEENFNLRESLRRELANVIGAWNRL
jgi:hypothetical protein